MREHVIWNGDNFKEVSDFVTSGVKYSESTRITNGEKKETKLLFILDEDSNWVPVDEGSYIWKNDNDTFYVTTDLPDDECDYENDDEPDCENCEYKDSCEDYSPDDDDESYDPDDTMEDECDDDDEYNYDENKEPGYDYTEKQQKRINFFKNELDELKKKIDKIHKLMGSWRWSELSDVRRLMLQGQLKAMKNYCFWLDKRLNWDLNLGE